MARRKSFTKKRRVLFLDTIRATGNVSEAARVIGLSRGYVYELRNGSNKIAAIKGFAEDWDEAEWQYIEECENEMKRRAYKGVKRLKEKRKVVMSDDGKEKVVEIIREATTFHSDALIQFHLTAKHPDYQKATKLELSGPGGKPIPIDDQSGWDLSGLTYEQLCQLRELQTLAKATPAPDAPK